MLGWYRFGGRGHTAELQTGNLSQTSFFVKKLDANKREDRKIIVEAVSMPLFTPKALYNHWACKEDAIDVRPLGMWTLMASSVPCVLRIKGILSLADFLVLQSVIAVLSGPNFNNVLYVIDKDLTVTDVSGI